MTDARARGIGVAGAVLCLAVLTSGATAQDPADRAWEDRDLDRAGQLYADRLAEDSTDTQALYRLALIRGWGEAYDESLALFDRLLRLAPQNLDARVARARVLAWKGELDRTIEDLRALLDANPSYRPALEALATFYSWDGDYDRALAMYDRLGQADLDNRGTAYQRARVLGWANRYGAARAVYDSLLAEEPGDVQALLGLAQVLAWSERLDSARTVYRRVLEENPDNLAARTGLARTTGYAGDLVAAEARWREVVEGNPENVDALLGLARTLRSQGRAAAAEPYLERALHLSPGNTEARQQMRWIGAALGPRAAPRFAYEWDSDGNNIVTTSGHAAFHPAPRVEVRVDAYHRSSWQTDVIDDPRASIGTTVTTQVQLSPGWHLAGSVGGSAPDVAGVDGAATYAVTVAAPARHQVRSALRASRELFDVTARLMANRVVYDQLQLDLGTRLERWTLQGATSVAWFRSRTPLATQPQTVIDETNRRLAADAAATRTLTPWFDLGGRVRAFGFNRALNAGYFDPDLFALFEVPATLSADLGTLDAALAVAPGVQQIGTDRGPDATVQTTGTVTWAPGPGRELSLRLLYAANGASPFAEEPADYRYFALNLGARWVF